MQRLAVVRPDGCSAMLLPLDWCYICSHCGQYQTRARLAPLFQLAACVAAKWNQNSIRVQHFCGVLLANTDKPEHSGPGTYSNSECSPLPRRTVSHLVVCRTESRLSGDAAAKCNLTSHQPEAVSLVHGANHLSANRFTPIEHIVWKNCLYFVYEWNP